MRPKKKILLLDSNEARSGMFELIFLGWQYRVTSCVDARKAMELAELQEFDLFLLDFGSAECRILTEFLRIRFSAPVIWICAKTPDQWNADDYCILEREKMCGLREKIRIKMVRKRGPRKADPQRKDVYAA